MPRWQDPHIETKTNCPRSYYFIRPYVVDFSTGTLARVRKVVRLGFCDETTMRKAHERKQQVMAQINQGQVLFSSQIPFAELVAKYREARLPHLGAATQANYTIALKNHILPVFGKAMLCDIDRQAVEAWLAREAQPHTHAIAVEDEDGQETLEPKEFIALGWHGRADLRKVLSAVFTAAIDWKLWHGENPCARVKLGPKVEKREKRIPAAADLQAFLDALPDTCIIGADGARLIALTAIVTGLRVSEVLGLRPEDIDAGKQTLRVVRRWRRGDLAERTKTPASKRVREIDALAAQLLAYAGDREWIFEREGEPPDDRDLQQHVFRPAAVAAGIYFEGFGLHTFRRLNISWRQEAGATPFEAMRAAGHTKPETTWLYTVTDGARERGHVKTILGRLEPPKAEAPVEVPVLVETLGEVVN